MTDSAKSADDAARTGGEVVNEAIAAMAGIQTSSSASRSRPISWRSTPA